MILQVLFIGLLVAFASAIAVYIFRIVPNHRKDIDGLRLEAENQHKYYQEILVQIDEKNKLLNEYKTSHQCHKDTDCARRGLPVEIMASTYNPAEAISQLNAAYRILCMANVYDRCTVNNIGGHLYELALAYCHSAEADFVKAHVKQILELARGKACNDLKAGFDQFKSELVIFKTETV